MKQITGFPGYFVDRKGNIFSNVFCSKIRGSKRNSKNKLRIIKPWLVAASNSFPGYYAVRMRSIYGKKKTKCVHILVLEAFKGPRPKGMIGLHGKKGPHINTPDNLSWGNHQQNTLDMLRDRSMSWGENHPTAKLTNREAKEIRELHSRKKENGLTNTQIAKPYGVTPQLISKIGLSRCWKYL